MSLKRWGSAARPEDRLREVWRHKAQDGDRVYDLRFDGHFHQFRGLFAAGK